MGLCIEAEANGNAGNANNGKVKDRLGVILLGIQGSGKSTFAKQMKILYSGGFEQTELDNYRTIIRKNFLLAAQELVSRAEALELYKDSDNLKLFRFFKGLSVYDTEWDEKLVPKLKSIFEDEAIQEIISSPSWRPQFRGDYLLEHFDRLTAPDYVPTPEDVIIARQRTTGQTLTTFIKDKYSWTLIDLGGQESERAKWEEIFQTSQINAALFLTSLDEYDTPYPSDKSKTSMQVSMETFAKVMNDEKLQTKSRMLFLNKTDLFLKRMQKDEDFEKFKKIFPKYSGTRSVDAAGEFIKSEFLSLVESPEEYAVQVHFTCALDTKAMDTVFAAVRTTVMAGRLAKAGLM